MARLVDSYEYSREFELGDWVSFPNPYSEGNRLYGKVVRVYSTRMNYHVEVDGHRYSTELHEMRKEKK